MSTRRHLTTAQVLALIDDWSEDNEPSEPDANDTSDGSEQDCSEHEDHNSESEQSESSASSDEDEHDDSPSTFLGKGEPRFVWNRRPPRTGRTRSHNILTQASGPTDAARRPGMMFQEAFNCIFDDSMIDLIVLYTNEYIASLQPQFAQSSNCRFTDREEIQAYIGCLYITGVLRSNHLSFEDIWASDGTGCDLIRAIMSCQRFLFLSRVLRFDSRADRARRRETDKMTAIRDLFEKFVANCRSSYSPSEVLTIDESVLPFRGRCSFRVYFGSAKPKSYGIKAYCMTDSTTFYALNMEIYLGAQSGQNPVDNSPAAVVTRLIHPVSGSGRNITTDNWYTSVPLALSLKRNHRLTLVGTIRKNRKEVPLEFIRTQQRELYSTIFGFTEDLTILLTKRNQTKL